MAFDFRYYDSISVREDTNNNNEFTVEMNVSYAKLARSVLMPLKKENGIWKMDILHMLEQ